VSIYVPGGGRAHADSTGKLIKVGDTIRFRGQDYTLKAFGPLDAAGFGVHTLIFEEPLHTDEEPHECNVDLVRES
jgi:hypothetical protein